MKLILLYTLALCCFTAALSAQNKISGQVTNLQTGEPLPGSNIHLIKSGKILTTGSDGYFNYVAGLSPDSMIITHVGYEPYKLWIDVSVSGQPLKIRMRPTTTLVQEVLVSTGYQTIPRERATGSFTILNSQKLNEQVSTDILSRLEPIANGLVFNRSTNATPQIQIRGPSTIKGPTSQSWSEEKSSDFFVLGYYC